MRNLYFAAIMLCTVLFGLSCSKNDNTAPDTSGNYSHLTAISTLNIPNTSYKVTSYITTDSVLVGYNPVLLTITDTTNGQLVTNGNVVLYPFMTMAGTDHAHSGPTEQPVYSDSAKGYLGAFMPIHGATAAYSTAGFTGWRMNMVVTINNTVYDTIRYDFSTKSIKTNTKFLTAVAGNDGNTYYLSLVTPQQAAQQNGIQTLEVGFYKGQNSNRSFVPVTDLTIGNFYPYMPDMGHSSTSNVIPVHIGNGHYTGAVNFTMGGFWTLNFTDIRENGNTVIDSTALEVAF